MSKRLTGALRMAGAAAVFTVAAACNDETATVLEPTSRTSYNFLMLKEGANAPRGAGGAVTVTRAIGASATQLTSTIAEFTIQGIEPLVPPAGYVMWIASIAPKPGAPADSILTNIARLRTNDFLAIEVDTTISAVGDFVPDVDTLRRQGGTTPATRAMVPAFNYGGPGVTYTFRTDSAAIGVYPHNRQIIFMTVVSDTANPGTPAADGSDARLWLRYQTAVPAVPTTAATTAATTPVWRFGNYHANVSKEYVFVPSGRGRASLLSDKQVLIVDDSLLARPPKGYFYQTWLITREDNQSFFAKDSILVDTLRAPYPRRSVSLFKADSTIPDPVVQAPAGFPQLQLIYAAGNRIKGDSLPGLAASGNRFRGVANVFVTLEHKLGIPELSPAVILNGTAPPPVRTRP